MESAQKGASLAEAWHIVRSATVRLCWCSCSPAEPTQGPGLASGSCAQPRSERNGKTSLHLINWLPFPQAHFSLLVLGPCLGAHLRGWFRSLLGLSGPLHLVSGGPDRSDLCLGWRLWVGPCHSAGWLGWFPTVLGDRLFLDRKLFKFSFSSDDLGGIQSTHVELRSLRDLAIYGVLRQSVRYFHSEGRVVGCGVSYISGGRVFPMGLLRDVEVISFLTGLWLGSHLVASDDLL